MAPYNVRKINACATCAYPERLWRHQRGYDITGAANFIINLLDTARQAKLPLKEPRLVGLLHAGSFRKQIQVYLSVCKFSLMYGTEANSSLPQRSAISQYRRVVQWWLTSTTKHVLLRAWSYGSLCNYNCLVKRVELDRMHNRSI